MNQSSVSIILEHFHERTIPCEAFIRDTDWEALLHVYVAEAINGLLFLREPGKAQDMKSEHIDNRKLYEIVNEAVILEQAEVGHLSTCEECLEMIRVLIRQNLAKDANH